MFANRMMRHFSVAIPRLRPLLTGLGVAAGLLTTGTAASAAEMTFRMVPIGDPDKCGSKCLRVIAAEGEIETTTPDAFVKFVMQNVGDSRARSIVFMHSPGGRVVASMELGKAFRKMGAAVIIARVGTPQPGSGLQANFATARCFSACAYALMGAKQRVVPPGSFVGIHRMFLLEQERDPDSPGGQATTRVFAESDMVRNLSRYAAMMGISRDLVTTAENVNPDNIHIVSENELRRWRLGSTKF